MSKYVNHVIVLEFQKVSKIFIGDFKNRGSVRKNYQKYLSSEILKTFPFFHAEYLSAEVSHFNLFCY